MKSRLPDLNQQHLDLQSNALPIELRRVDMGLPGFEPESQAPKAQRMTKLPYSPITTLIILITIVYKCYHFYNIIINNRLLKEILI